MMIPPVQEKDRDKKEKEKDVKEKDKKAINGHLFTPTSSGQATQCSQCNKAFNNKDVFQCTREYFFFCFFFFFAVLSLQFLFFHCLFKVCFKSNEKPMKCCDFLFRGFILLLI